MGLNEADTRSKLIDPKLYAAGWIEETISREYPVSAGTIVFNGTKGKRKKPKAADYVLRYKGTARVAVVEAKKEELSALEGFEQAQNYALKLGIPFAYTTNGHEIEFINTLDNTSKTVESFHSPDELWQLYLDHLSVVDEKLTSILVEPNYEEVKIGNKKVPRYYQENAVEKILEAMVTGKNRILVNMATGTGKTFTSVQTIYKVWRSKFAKKILFLVDRNILADQAFRDFDNVFENGACWRLKPEETEFNKSRSIYFGIYQTLLGEGETEKKYKSFPPDFFDLIVIDECHRGASNEDSEWFSLLEYFSSATQIGLTATPRREESADTYEYFGEPVITYSLKQGIEDGYLAPYIIKRVKSNLDVEGLKVENEKDIRNQNLTKHKFAEKDFEKKVSLPSRTKFYAQHLVKHLVDTDLFGKTIVFCINKQHAADMSKFINEAYYELVEKFDFPKIDGFSVRITGDDRDSNGKYPMLEKFKKIDSPLPVVVTTSKLLTTGVDVKNVKNIVIFREIHSISEFKQIIGRGTRIYEQGGSEIEKLGFYILEYGNNSTQLFYDPDFDGEPSSVEAEDYNEENKSTSADVPPQFYEDEKKGLFDDKFRKKIKYRMSDQFYKDEITKGLEQTILVDGNGNEIEVNQYVANQQKIILEIIQDYETFIELWIEPAARKKILERIYESNIDLKIISDFVVGEKNEENVDILDVLLAIGYDKKILSKSERIKQSSIFSNKVISNLSEKQKEFLNCVLDVYTKDGNKPLEFTPNFFKIIDFDKLGVRNLTDALNLLGGVDNFKLVAKEINNSIYRIEEIKE